MKFGYDRYHSYPNVTNNQIYTVAPRYDRLINALIPIATFGYERCRLFHNFTFTEFYTAVQKSSRLPNECISTVHFKAIFMNVIFLIRLMLTVRNTIFMSVDQANIMKKFNSKHFTSCFFFQGSPYFFKVQTGQV